MSTRSGDERLVRSAARRLGVQAAALVAAAMLLVVALVGLVSVHAQRVASDRDLRSTAQTVDDVGDPPAGAWVVIARADRTSTSPGLPEDLKGRLAALRAGLGTAAALSTLTDGDGEHFRALSVRRVVDTPATTSDPDIGPPVAVGPGPAVVQVVLSLQQQQEQRDQLLRTAAGTGALSLLLAAGLGALLGRRAVRPLADALRLQRAFVADASHELRTPLTLLSTRAQLLERQVGRVTDDPRARQDAAGVVRDVQRLGGVVDDLLAAADPRADRPAELIDLDELVAEVADSARAHAAEQAVGIAVARRSGATVAGAPAALRRGLLALVDNAVDHTPAGGQVHLGVVATGRSVTVTVTDSGPGVPADRADRVLSRFSSGGQRAGRAHYGLGLALTSDVADRHGGSLRLAPSAPGTGARFELVLPLAGRRR